MRILLTLLGIGVITFSVRADDTVRIDFSNRAAEVKRASSSSDEAVIRAVFPHFLKDASLCDGKYDGDAINPERLAGEREAGQFVPSVIASVEGSFTGPKKHETLYLIRVGECFVMTPTADWSTYVLVVFSGFQLIARWDPSANGLAGTVNFEGVDLVALEARSMSTRRATIVARLVSLKNGHLKEIRDLGLVYENRCSISGHVRSAIVAISAKELSTQWQEGSCQAAPVPDR